MLRLSNVLPAIPPAARALLAQLLATTLMLLMPSALPPLAWVMMQGVLVAGFSYGFGLAPWWLPMQFLFVPMILITASLNLPPYWFLIGFFALVTVYWGAVRGQVPLYFSNRAAQEAVATLLPSGRPFAFADLGCGLAGMLVYLAKARADGRFVGVETAPLSYVVSRLRAAFNRGRCRVAWQSLWQHDLAPYDVVYAYLSPVPMPELWKKAKREMYPGSLLVSNSFTVPGVTPSFSLPLRSGGSLYVWRM